MTITLIQIFQTGCQAEYFTSRRLSISRIRASGFAIFLLLITTPAKSQPLDTLLALLPKNNPELQALNLEYQAALQIAPQVSQLPDPELKLGWFPLPPETRLGPQRMWWIFNQMLPWPGKLEAQKQLAKKISEVAAIANEATRKISHSLDSGVLKHFGLATAVQELTDAVNDSQAVAISSHIQLNEQLDSEVSLNIYRIIQELITNIIKHAQATEATIHLTQHEDSLNIMVEDNGSGFDPAKIKPSLGMGIYSIQKRIENIGGTVAIDSIINKGTTVIIDIPLA